MDRDHDVEREGRQADSQHKGSDNAEQPCRAWPKHAGDEWPVPGASHPRIEVALDILVERSGAGRRQQDRHAQHDRFPAGFVGAAGSGHARQCGQRDGKADPQLEDRIELDGDRAHGRFSLPYR